MIYKTALKSLNGDEITLLSKDKVNAHELNKYTYNGNIYAVVEFVDGTKISDEQRKHFYALMGDYEAYTGVPLNYVENWYKVAYMIYADLNEKPSLARGKMSKAQATDFLTFIIEDFIEKGIRFRKQRFYNTVDIGRMIYALTMKRLCAVCGKKHADIHHVTSVGMGRNRKKHDHTQHLYLPLCREHHNESHNLGQETFMKKYHLEPIELKEEDLKELNII